MSNSELPVSPDKPDISELLARATSELQHNAADKTDTARLDAEILLAHCLGENRAYLFTWPEKAPEPATCKHFFDLITQRGNGVPLAYLTGEREFWSLNFKVTTDTLIPRPETELLVQLALDLLAEQATSNNKPGPVLDLGTGTGAIAISIASEYPDIDIDAVDNNLQTLAVAWENAIRHQTNVNLIQSDWLAEVTRTDYYLVVSNPPYIAEHDPHLKRGGLQHEPVAALKAEDSGMAAIKTIANNTAAHCQSGAWLLIEHGYDQGPQTRAVLQQAGFSSIRTEQDLESRDRVTLGQVSTEPK